MPKKRDEEDVDIDPEDGPDLDDDSDDMDVDDDFAADVAIEFDADSLDDDFDDEPEETPPPRRKTKRKSPKQVVPMVEGIPKSRLDKPDMVKKAWDKLAARLSGTEPTKYSIRECLTVDAVVDHPKFGIGYVVDIPAASKAEIIFEDRMRRMVHNR